MGATDKLITHFIVLEPITPTFRSALDALKSQRDAQNVEMVFISDPAEATQLTFMYSPCIVAFSVQTPEEIAPKLAFLKSIGGKIEANEIKVLAVNKLVNDKLTRALEQLKLSVVVTEPIAPRTLMFKLLLQIKAVDVIRKSIEIKRKQNERIAIKSSPDGNKTKEDAVRMSWKNNASAPGAEKFVLNAAKPAGQEDAEKKVSAADEGHDSWQRSKTENISGPELSAAGPEAGAGPYGGGEVAEGDEGISLEGEGGLGGVGEPVSVKVRRAMEKAQAAKAGKARPARERRELVSEQELSLSSPLNGAGDERSDGDIEAGSDPTIEDDPEIRALDDLIRRAKDKAKARRDARAQKGLPEDAKEEEKERQAVAAISAKVEEMKESRRSAVREKKARSASGARKDEPAEAVRSTLARELDGRGSRAGREHAATEALEEGDLPVGREEPSSGLARTRDPEVRSADTTGASAAKAGQKMPEEAPVETVPEMLAEERKRKQEAGDAPADPEKKPLSAAERLAAIRRKRREAKSGTQSEFVDSTGGEPEGDREPKGLPEDDLSEDLDEAGIRGESERKRGEKLPEAKPAPIDRVRQRRPFVTAEEEDSGADTEADAGLPEAPPPAARVRSRRKGERGDGCDSPKADFDLGGPASGSQGNTASDIATAGAEAGPTVHDRSGEGDEERVSWLARNEADDKASGTKSADEELVTRRLKAEVTPDPGVWTRIAFYYIYLPDRVLNTRHSHLEETLPICIYEGSGKPRSSGRLWLFRGPKVDVVTLERNLPEPVRAFLRKFVNAADESEEQAVAKDGVTEGPTASGAELGPAPAAPRRRRGRDLASLLPQGPVEVEPAERPEGDDSLELAAGLEAADDSSGVETSELLPEKAEAPPETASGAQLKRRRNKKGDALSERESALFTQDNEEDSLTAAPEAGEDSRDDPNDDRIERRSEEDSPAKAEAEEESGLGTEPTPGPDIGSDDAETAAGESELGPSLRRRGGRRAASDAHDSPAVETGGDVEPVSADEHAPDPGDEADLRQRGEETKEAGRDGLAEPDWDRISNRRHAEVDPELDLDRTVRKKASVQEGLSPPLLPEKESGSLSGPRGELLPEIAGRERDHVALAQPVPQKEKDWPAEVPSEEESSSRSGPTATGLMRDPAAQGALAAETARPPAEIVELPAGFRPPSAADGVSTVPGPIVNAENPPLPFPASSVPPGITEEKVEIVPLDIVKKALLGGQGVAAPEERLAFGGTRAEQIARSLNSRFAGGKLRSRGEEIALRLAMTSAAQNEEQQLKALHLMASHIQRDFSELQVAIVAAEPDGALRILAGGQRFRRVSELHGGSGFCWTTLARISEARRRVGIVVYPRAAGVPLTDEALAYLARVMRAAQGFLAAA